MTFAISNVSSLHEAREALHVSVSQIRAFLICPMKHRHTYILRTPPSHRACALAFGSAVHAAIAAFYERLRDEKAPLPIEDLHGRFDTEWEAQLAAGDVLFGDDEDAGSLRTAAHGMLAVFVSDGFQPREILGIEVPFSVPIPGREEQLVGAFDLVARDTDGRILIVEHKTAARRYSDDQLRYDLQPTAYVFAARELGLGGLEDVQVMYQVITKTKKPAVQLERVTRCSADVSDLRMTIDGVLGAVEAAAYWPVRGWACSACPYSYACSST